MNVGIYWFQGIKHTGKFELASSGTALLDKNSDMPSDMQVKLLRVLQTGEIYRVGEHKPIAVDFRIIAATHLLVKGITEIICSFIGIEFTGPI